MNQAKNNDLPKGENQTEDTLRDEARQDKNQRDESSEQEETSKQ